MVAAFDIVHDYGGIDGTPGTSDVITALVFKNADDATTDSTNPIIITAATTKYSRWKQLYAKCTTAPSVQCDNFRFYTDGSSGLGTGITLKAGGQFPTKNSGSSAGYEVAGTADEELIAGHGGITSSASAFTYTSGSPLSLSISEAGSIINAINETTNYLCLQMEVIDTASPGLTAAETLTWAYDEI